MDRSPVMATRVKNPTLIKLILICFCCRCSHQAEYVVQQVAIRGAGRLREQTQTIRETG